MYVCTFIVVRVVSRLAGVGCQTLLLASRLLSPPSTHTAFSLSCRAFLDTSGLFPTTPSGFLHEEPRGGRRRIDVRLRGHRVSRRDYRTRQRRPLQFATAADPQVATNKSRGRGKLRTQKTKLVPGPRDVASGEQGPPGGGVGREWSKWTRETWGYACAVFAAAVFVWVAALSWFSAL